jgi:predicted RNase H-like nuclease (RuvC/YqgF family)
MTDIQEQQPVQVESASAPIESNSAPAAAPAPQEAMIPQSEVNRIVSTQKKEAYEKGLTEAQRQAQQASHPVQQAPAGQGNWADLQAKIAGLESKLEKTEQERQQELLNAQYQQRVQNVANSLAPQIEEAKKQFDDFDEVTSRFNLEHDFALMEMAAQTPNGARALYELGKNPGKIFALQQMAQQRPDFAAYEIQKLSQSIANNQMSQEAAKTPDPLSQVQSSNVGNDSGAMTLKDMKAKFRA